MTGRLDPTSLESLVEGIVASLLPSFVRQVLSALAAAPAAPRRGRGRPLAAASGDSKRDAKRERDRRRYAAQRVAAQTASGKSNPESGYSDHFRPAAPPAAPPARPPAVSEISSLSAASPEKTERETPSGISLPSLEGASGKSNPESGYPTYTHTERDMTQPGRLTVDEALEAYREGVRAVVGPQWEPEGPPAEHRQAVASLAAAALRQHPSPDPVQNEATIRHNVRRFAAALAASPLILKRFAGPRAWEWLNANGYEAAPRPRLVKVKPAEPPPRPMTAEDFERLAEEAPEGFLREMHRANAKKLRERERRHAAGE